MLKRLASSVASQQQVKRQADLQHKLLRREAKIGGRLFGPVPKGHRREFFCLDEHTWVWHEEWTDGLQRSVKTTRYSVRPDAILKSHDGRHYQKLDIAEAKNFLHATQTYNQRIRSELYNFA